MAYLLQRYLGNYVRGLNKEALKISVWQGWIHFILLLLFPSHEFYFRNFCQLSTDIELLIFGGSSFESFITLGNKNM